MGMSKYFYNIIYAVTGKQKDESKDFLKRARDLMLPRVLNPRDKHNYKDAEFFRYSIQYVLGYTRFALSEDRAHGESSVQRVYLTRASHGYVAFLELAYAGGLDFEEMKKIIPEMLDAIAYCDPLYQETAYLKKHNHVLDLTPFYFSAFFALAFFVALRRNKEDISQLLVATGEAGQDQLYDRVVQRIDPDRDIGPKIKIAPHYNLLVEAMDAEPTAQTQLLVRFLDGWYEKICKLSEAHNTHLREAYTGYFSYEAAAVVMLWDIDDSAFRDHPYYPDALVDYYRKTGSQGT